MKISRFFAAPMLAALMNCGISWAAEQPYPNRPIRVLVSEVGGAGDFAGRILAQGFTNNMGQQGIVENRPGGFMSGQVAKNASPDGYTVLVAGSNLWLQPFMRSNVPFDPVKDFAPITLLTTSPLIVVVHPSIAVSSIKELIALAKAKPGVLNYGSGNAGSSSHLGVELFKSMTGANIVRIPYKGVGPALNALVAGEVQMMIASAGSATPHVKSGRLRALAVTGAQPSALVPGLPTVASSGLTGYEFSQTLAAQTPAKTPVTLINRLNREIIRIVQDPEVKQKFFNAGVEIATTTPKELGALIKSDMTRLGKVIRDAGIKEEWRRPAVTN